MHVCGAAFGTAVVPTRSDLCNDDVCTPKARGTAAWQQGWWALLPRDRRRSMLTTGRSFIDPSRALAKLLAVIFLFIVVLTLLRLRTPHCFKLGAELQPAKAAKMQKSERSKNYGSTTDCSVLP
jgi:hypothetical protein